MLEENLEIEQVEEFEANAVDEVIETEAMDKIVEEMESSEEYVESAEEEEILYRKQKIFKTKKENNLIIL